MKQKILLLFALLTLVSVTKAQDTEFWFAAPDIRTGYDSPVMFTVANTTAIEGSVTITLNNGGSPVVTTYSISADGFLTYSPPIARVENPLASAGSVTDYGIHIISTVPIITYYQIQRFNNQDVFALKGSSALGTLFYVPMVFDSYYTTSAHPAHSGAIDQIDIVASEDGTTVTVVPTAPIRIAPSGTSPAGTVITRTLNKGQTLKIVENAVGNPTLAGTKITSNKPIAVTTTEDLIGHSTGNPSTGQDVIGDQIVPVSSLGKNHIVPKGFLSTTRDRVYMTATEGGTVITANSGTITTSGILNAGDSWVFDLGLNGYTEVGPLAVYITANNPIYCYQVSGITLELGSALIPSLYSIGQNQLSFYQNANHSSDEHYIFVVFRTGAHNDFEIKIGDNAYQPLSVTPIVIPGLTDWKTARIKLSTAGQNKVITVRNTGSPFSLGYFAADNTNGGASYGYLSAFGESMPAIYKCPDAAVTIDGGSAGISHKWMYSPTYDGTYTLLPQTTQTITVSNEGYYALEKDLDPGFLRDTTYVQSIHFQEEMQYVTDVSSSSTIFTPSINPDLTSDPNLKISYDWQFDNGTPSTSSDATPTVTWTGETLTAKLTLTAEANSASSTGGCSTTLYMYLMPDQDVCTGKAEAINASSFILPGGSTPTSYQWQSSKDDATWTDITENGTGSSYAISPQKRSLTYYRVLMDGMASESTRIRLKSCILLVNHNISIMGYYD